MAQDLLQAKSELEANRLQVTSDNDVDYLRIVATWDEHDGIRVSQDACNLIPFGDEYRAVFPAKGLSLYEVGGPLTRLVPLIVKVYKHYRSHGGSLNEAFELVVDDAEQYLTEKSPSNV